MNDNFKMASPTHTEPSNGAIKNPSVYLKYKSVNHFQDNSVSYSSLFRVLLIILFVIISDRFVRSQGFTGSLAQFSNFPEGAVYQDTSLSPQIRVDNLVSLLSFEETLAMTGGTDIFFYPGIERLGLRKVFMADASQGLRLKVGFTPEDISTSFPGTLALAATWNESLAEKMGRALGEECLAYGVDILLGPGINFQRFSVSGRNFEYMGEDPLLTSKLAVKYIQGLQSQKVLATAKHFVCNDQEFCRHLSSSDIDERTLREIYLRPWKSVIQEAGVKAIMAGNNQVNGIPMSMDKPLIHDVVRDEFGFTGMVMTDWSNSVYVPDLQYLFPSSGVSLLMPRNKVFRSYLEAYLQQHPEKRNLIWDDLKKKAYQNFLPLFEMGVYDRSGEKDPERLSGISDHKTMALEIASEAITLLKNESNLLPLSSGAKVLLAGKEEVFSGVGSGFVEGYDHCSFAKGLQGVLGDRLVISPDPTESELKAADVVIYRLSKEGGEGQDVPFELGLDSTLLSITLHNENIVVVISSSNGLPMPWLPDVKSVLWTYFLGQERGQALADIIVGKVNPSGKLPFTLEKDFQDSQFPTFNFLGNQPYWFGDTRIYRKYWLGESDTIESAQFMEYVQPKQIVRVPYKEGVFMGYRWYEAQKKEVLFPFGHGLSYTTFLLSDFKVSSKNMEHGEVLKVSCMVENTGETKGATVVQLYLSDRKSGVRRPPKELKGFEKVLLDKGENQLVTFTLEEDDLAFWDVGLHDWHVEPGYFDISIGTSSRGIQVQGSFEWKE